MSFTSNTMIVESPLGGAIYLEMDGERIVDAVIYKRADFEEDFDVVMNFILREFQLSEKEEN